MAEPIRLSNDETVRSIPKTIYTSVEVTIRPEEIAATLTRDEVVRLCARHNIQLKRNGGRGSRKTKIAAEDLLDISERMLRGDIDGALIELERVLPPAFRHFSEDVARFYQGRAS